MSGLRPTAIDAFAAFYKLEDCAASPITPSAAIDALALPTAPTIYTVKQVLADPIQLNSRLGTYTNFVNLLDLCGLALPAAITEAGAAFRHHAAGAGRRRRAAGRDRPRLPCRHSACRSARSKRRSRRSRRCRNAPADGEIAVAVVGAHLSGLPLNGELRALGGRLLATAKTAPDYRLYALSDTTPPKPGLLRVERGKGVGIEVEIWALPVGVFGHFADGVAAPLSIGTVTLADGRAVKGFLVEAAAAAGARDISSFGGWRAFLAREKMPA